jgi:integrase
MEIKLPHILQDTDRHGNPRLYVRKIGRPMVRLRSKPGTPAFFAEYESALRQIATPKPKLTVARRQVTEQSLEWVVRRYEKSHDFAQLEPRSQRVRSSILQSCLDEPLNEASELRFGACPIDRFEAKFVRLMRDRKKETPGAANNRVRALRVVLGWAVENDLAKSNVAKDVKPLKYQKEGFHSWTQEEVAQFEARHPLGSKARLALALLMFTGVRRSDVVKLGPTLIKGGSLVFMPEKTCSTTAKVLDLPILPPLRAVLNATLTGLETFLETERGQPFTSNGFGNWFRERCDEAGLPQCSAHGLRKHGADMAAENGATEAQMMSMFGWDSAAMAAHYHKKANQKKLAAGAMHLLIGT